MEEQEPLVVDHSCALPSHPDRNVQHPMHQSSIALGPNSARIVIDGKGSNWHQSPISTLHQCDKGSTKSSDDSLPVLDFDLLCATVAMQREPLSIEIQKDAGVQRMWEGGVLDCFDDTEIALQTFCCPCVTHGKNLARAGFGGCLSKSGIYFVLLAGAVISYILFLCALGHFFLYLALLLLISVAAYASYYRVQIRRRFNIKGSHSDGAMSALDDTLNHFICGCCTLCQEARTLEMNNVRDGNWHGRGDTIWVGSYAMPQTQLAQCTEMKRPVVITVSADSKSREADVHSVQESCQLLMDGSRLESESSV